MVNTGVEMLILENCMLTAFAIDNIYSLVLLPGTLLPERQLQCHWTKSQIGSRELCYQKGSCNAVGQSLNFGSQDASEVVLVCLV